MYPLLGCLSMCTLGCCNSSQRPATRSTPRFYKNRRGSDLPPVVPVSFKNETEEHGVEKKKSWQQTPNRGVAKGDERSGGDDDDDDDDAEMRAQRSRHMRAHESKHIRTHTCKHTWEIRQMCAHRREHTYESTHRKANIGRHTEKNTDIRAQKRAHI